MEEKIIKLKSEHMTLDDVEALISESLGEAVKSVIAIGYHLKYIRDHKLYQEAGYLDIWTYAHGRYGFSKSTTSRYISRNDKFSKGGNSLILDERYQDYGKAQLQEMLSLDEEQLTQVTPDMTARQIREMRKPKEAPEPCIEIPGQIELQDLVAEDAQPAEDAARTSQQEELSAYGTPRKVYPEGSLLSTEGCEDGDSCFSCALDCRIRQRYRYCVEAPLGAPFPCSMMDQMGTLRDDKGDRCQFINPDLAHHCAGNGAPSPCCKRCDEICDLRCARSKKSTSEPAEAAVATSQQDEHSSCPPQVSGCRRQEWGTSPEQQQDGQKECAECWAEWKERQRVLGAAGTQQEADPAAGLRSGTMRIEADREQRASKEDDTKKGDDGRISGFYKDLYPSTRQVIVQRDRAAITKEFRKLYGDTYENGEGWSAYPDKIVFRDSPGAEQIQITWGRLTTKLLDFLERCPEVERSALTRDADPQGEGDGIRDRILCDTCEHSGECAGKKTHSDGCMGYEESSVEGHGLTASEGDAKGISVKAVKAYDKRMLEEMIERCEGELEIMQEYWMQHIPNAYTKHMMQIRAYKDLLAAKAEEEQAEEEPAEEPIEQPPFPDMKNNDQRKAWLDTYHEWPVWFEVPQAGEVYYRYDLEDGYSLVICEYHTYQEWREQYKKDPDVTRTREYILTPGYHYLYDCQSSRTCMIEHLKEMRKKRKDDR